VTAPTRQPLRRIEVEVRVGEDRMAATDDPIFLGLRGPEGREFRLAPSRGKPWRRGGEDRLVLAGPEDAETNVERPELNDPQAPSIDLGAVTGVYLRKGQEPIPNVRGLGEMDDRLQVASAEVVLHAGDGAPPRRFARREAFWLGLVCGLVVDLPPADAGE